MAVPAHSLTPQELRQAAAERAAYETSERSRRRWQTEQAAAGEGTDFLRERAERRRREAASARERLTLRDDERRFAAEAAADEAEERERRAAVLRVRRDLRARGVGGELINQFPTHQLTRRARRAKRWDQARQTGSKRPLRKSPRRLTWPLLVAPAGAAVPAAVGCRAAAGWKQTRLRGTRGERAVRLGAGPCWVRGPPPPKHVPSRLSVATEHGAAAATKLRAHGEKMWLKGWLAEAPSQDPQVLVREYGACITPMFLREAQHQKPRPCQDLRYVNAFERTEKFKEEDLRHLPEWGEPRMKVWQKDAEGAFTHAFLQPEAQRTQVQDWGPPPPGPPPPGGHRPRFAVPLVMLFGWCRAPKIWREIRRPMQEDLTAEGHRNSWFADDGLGGAASTAMANEGERRCSELFGLYGIREAPDKGMGNVRVGQQPVGYRVRHLGIDLDFEPAQGLYIVPEHKAKAIQRHARGLLGQAARHRRWVSRRWVQQYYCLLLSLITADREARFRTRMIIDNCKAAGCFRGRRGNWSGEMKLNRYALGELRWGARYLAQKHRRCVWRPPVTHLMATDASKDPAPPPTAVEAAMDGEVPPPRIHAGWGVVHYPGGGPNGRVGQSPVEQAALLAATAAAGVEQARRRPSAGASTLAADAVAGRTARPPRRDLTPEAAAARAAQQQAVAAAQEQYTPGAWRHTRVAHGVFSPAESKMMIAWLEMRAVRHGVRAGGELLRDATLLLWEDNSVCVGIIKKGMSKSPVLHREYSLLHAELAALNCRILVRWVASADQPADFWTRLLYRSDWHFATWVLEAVFELWGEPTVDRFAQPHDAVCARYNTPYPHPGAEATDAWTQAWGGEFNWLNPPWSMVGRVVDRLRKEVSAEAVVVVPCFSARWLPGLLALATDARQLVLAPADIIPGPVARASPEPLRNSAWRLVAFYVPSGAAARASRRLITPTEGAWPRLEQA